MLFLGLSTVEHLFFKKRGEKREGREEKRGEIGESEEQKGGERGAGREGMWAHDMHIYPQELITLNCL